MLVVSQGSTLHTAVWGAKRKCANVKLYISTECRLFLKDLLYIRYSAVNTWGAGRWREKKRQGRVGVMHWNDDWVRRIMHGGLEC